ncbi:MAG: phosphoglucosamine mutase [Ignavibacteria bacterium]|jgi:phosphomannomutase|nr:phosphoglucosamine mutase [Ignavibacteria bacterium]
MAVINSISGMRATLDELSEQFIRKYAIAFHKFLPTGKIILGRDGRPSGKWIEELIINTFESLGRKVYVLGVVPTPTVQLIVENFQAVGGIIITASHNPHNWNGLKFLNSDGIFLDAEENKAFWKILEEEQIDIFSHTKETADYSINANDFHINKILEIDFIANQLDNIRSKKYKIVVDAVNASGSKIVVDLLKKFNCEVVELFCDGTGIFPHTPEPLPENLSALANAVKEHNADIGVAVDPDADRLVLIDENASPIGEERTICLAVQSFFEINPSPTRKVVVNQSTTMLVDFIASMYSADVHRTAVGEINVVSKMREVGASIGGEGSGGVILSQCHYGRDSLVGITLVLALLAKKDMNLSAIVNTYPQYKMQKIKLDFQGDFQDLGKLLVDKYKNYKISLIDGIKVYFDNAWVHIRKSNTEPIIRIIGESVNSDDLELRLSDIKQIVNYTRGLVRGS